MKKIIWALVVCFSLFISIVSADELSDSMQTLLQKWYISTIPSDSQYYKGVLRREAAVVLGRFARDQRNQIPAQNCVMPNDITNFREPERWEIIAWCLFGLFKSSYEFYPNSSFTRWQLIIVMWRFLTNNPSLEIDWAYDTLLRMGIIKVDDRSKSWRTALRNELYLMISRVLAKNTSTNLIYLTESDFQLYTNQTIGIQFNYPKFWWTPEVQTFQGMGSATGKVMYQITFSLMPTVKITARESWYIDEMGSIWDRNQYFTTLFADTEWFCNKTELWQRKYMTECDFLPTSINYISYWINDGEFSPYMSLNFIQKSSSINFPYAEFSVLLYDLNTNNVWRLSNTFANVKQTFNQLQSTWKPFSAEDYQTLRNSFLTWLKNFRDIITLYPNEYKLFQGIKYFWESFTSYRQ